MSFLQVLSHVQFAMSSHFTAVRIGRRLSGCFYSQATPDSAYLQFAEGSIGAECFAFLTCANTGQSGWTSLKNTASLYVRFDWSLEAEAASDGGW